MNRVDFRLMGGRQRPPEPDAVPLWVWLWLALVWGVSVIDVARQL